MGRTALTDARGRWLGEVLLLGVAYGLLAAVGLELQSFDGHASPMWPPAGLAAAWMAVRGVDRWPGVALGAGGAALAFGATPLLVLPLGLLAAASARVVVAVLGDASLAAIRSRRDIIRLFTAGACGSAVAAAIGAPLLTGLGPAPVDATAAIAGTWFMGDLVGITVGAPVVASLLSRPHRLGREARLEIALLCAAAFAIGLAATKTELADGYLLLLPLGWLAVRQGSRGVMWGLMAVAAVAAHITTNGLGPFAADSTNLSLARLDWFLLLAVAGAHQLSVVLADLREALADRTSAARQAAANAEDLRRVVRALSRAESRFRMVFEEAPIGVALLDRKGRVLRVNRSHAATLGYSPSQMEGRSASDFVHPEERLDRLADAERFERGEIDNHCVERRLVRSDGQVVVAEIQTIAERDADGVAHFYFSLITDVTERREAERRLQHSATHDELTGLPNRTLTLDRVDRALQADRRAERITALLFIDLDRFKVINDVLGHAVGDEVICAVAERLTRAVRGADTVGRFGGDEFVILCPNLVDDLDVANVVQRVREVLDEPVTIGGRRLDVNASMGVAVAQAGVDPRDLLRHADAAMYRAKELGRDRVERFDEELEAVISWRHEVEQRLGPAIRNGELRLVYQPQVDLLTCQPCGVEALLRWDHPERGLLSPVEFLDVAEETGQIAAIGTWVLQEASRQAAAWGAGTPAGLIDRVAVNLSASQLLQEDAGTHILTTILDAGARPETITFEVTESVLIQDVETAARVLDELRGAGCLVGIDDFGTGYSSLRYLTGLPIDFLKVDRSFVAGLDDSPRDRSVVEAVIRLARAMGLTTVAEGVEQLRQAEELALMGVDHAQGYFYGRPAPSALIPTLMAALRESGPRPAAHASRQVDDADRPVALGQGPSVAP